MSIYVKQQIVEIGRRIYQRGFVAANDGNISVRISENEILATPTGVSKGFMQPEMIVKVDLNGNLLQGDRKPSSELKMHLRVYRENPNVKAVVHAHPLFATAYAIARMPLDKPIVTEGVLQLGTVPVAEYATPGTEEVPDSIAPFCRDYNAVLLANHGVLTWGRDLEQAWMRMETTEYYATITTLTDKVLGAYHELTEQQLERLIEIRNMLSMKQQ